MSREDQNWQKLLSEFLYTKSPDYELSEAVFSCLKEPQEGMDPADGLKIYRNNLRVTLLEALQGNFPLTQKWIGKDAFSKLAYHYIYAHPSGSFNLDRYGEELAEFVENDPIAKEYPALSDFVRLERLWNEALDWQEDSVLTADQLNRLIQNGAIDTKVRMRKSVVLLRCKFSVFEVFQGLRREEKGAEMDEISSPPEEEQWIVVKKDQSRREVQVVEEPLIPFVSALEASCSFEELMKLDIVQENPERLQEALGVMLSRKWIAEI